MIFKIASRFYSHPHLTLNSYKGQLIEFNIRRHNNSNIDAAFAHNIHEGYMVSRYAVETYRIKQFRAYIILQPSSCADLNAKWLSNLTLIQNASVTSLIIIKQSPLRGDLYDAASYRQCLKWGCTIVRKYKTVKNCFL